MTQTGLTRTGVTPRARGPPRYPAMTQKTRRTSSPKTLFRRCKSLLACPYQGYPRVTRPGPEDHAAPRGHAHVRGGLWRAEVPVTGGCRPVPSAGNGLRAFPAHLSGSGRKAQVTRDTASNPGGGGTRGPRRPADRRHPRTAAAEHATGDQPWSSGLTGPQRVFPAWDGVPGYEFEGRRAAQRPPPPERPAALPPEAAEAADAPEAPEARGAPRRRRSVG